MKDTAKVLTFKGRELKTPADINSVQEALWEDLTSGAVTPREARQIQKEIGQRLKAFRSMVKTLKLERDLITLLEKKPS